jgi:hypothetical protein
MDCNKELIQDGGPEVCCVAGMPDFHLSRFFFQFTFAASAFSLGSQNQL